MISLSTDTNDFWNNQDEEALLFLYGVGTNSEAMIDLVDRAGIKIEGFIDQDEKKASHYFNKYQIFSFEHIKTEYKNRKIKIFSTIDHIFGAIVSIENSLDNVTVYMPPVGRLGGDINTAIAPLREKLIRNKDFTVIGNTCAAARIYQFVNVEYKSPFMCVIIKPQDYLNICANLEKYLSYDLKFIRLEEWQYPEKFHSLCKLGDAEIKFIGKTDFDEIKQNWTKRIKRINWDNLFFIWEDFHYSASTDMYNKFAQIPIGTKLIFLRNVYYPCKHAISSPANVNFFENRLLEKWFRIVDFLNHDIEY